MSDQKNDELGAFALVNITSGKAAGTSISKPHRLPKIKLNITTLLVASREDNLTDCTPLANAKQRTILPMYLLHSFISAISNNLRRPSPLKKAFFSNISGCTRLASSFPTVDSS